MIINKMQKLCKKSMTIQIVKYGVQNFLTNGYVAALIDAEAPGWNEDDIAISLGLPRDKRSNYIKQREVTERPAIDITNMTPVIRLNYAIRYFRTMLIPFMTDNGMVFFVDEDRYKLFEDGEPDGFYLGSIGNGMDPVMVVTDCGVPIGIIAPERLNVSDIKNFASQLHRGLLLAETNGFFDTGHQMEIEEPSEAESEDEDDVEN